MKLKVIPLAVTTLILGTNVFASTKTIDFYSTNGTNRYSIEGKINELGLEVNNNSLLIPDANNQAYVKLNQDKPNHLRFIRDNKHINEIIEANKGKNINYKGANVKLLGMSNDKVMAEKNGSVIFIDLENIEIPKSFLEGNEKGLKVTFSKPINPNDVLYYSQPEAGLSYKNTYQANIKEEGKISLTHYLNIQNNTQNNYENVYLNFFLSETQVMMPRMQSVAANAKMMVAASPVAEMADMSFEQNELQDLKQISLKSPVNIYKDMNKIKYLEKDFPLKQYVEVTIEPINEIYLRNETGLSKNDMLKIIEAEQDQIRNRLKDNLIFQNVLDIELDKNIILPNGVIDIYEPLKGRDNLIISTSVSHTEKENLKVIKNRNNSLKVKDIKFKELDVQQLLNKKINPINFKIESVDVRNEDSKAYTLRVNNKNVVIPANSTVTVKLN